MSHVSPTLEGFRASFRRPSLTFAEIAWRWTVGAVAWGLFLFWFIEYLDTLPVTNGDVTLLSTRQPFLVGRAIAHIFRGSLSRAVLTGLLAVIALSLLWIIAASVGRTATVRALLAHFRGDAVCNPTAETHGATELHPLRSPIGLNFLRAALALAAILAFVGAAFLSALPRRIQTPTPAWSSSSFCRSPVSSASCGRH
jgi:fucose permease